MKPVISSEIEKVKAAELIPYARNSRTHSDEQVQQIASSIKEFGFTNPVLISEGNDIIAGHGRLLAAQLLGIDEVPCIRLAHLNEQQRKAYVIADNKLALNAGWDSDLLALELGELKDGEFDLSLTGFTEDELAALLIAEQVEGLTDEDAAPEPEENPISVEGDVWVCGNHRVMCGDSTSVDAVNSLMNGSKADMVFTDPPYGMRLNADYSNMPGTTTKYDNVIGDHEDFDAQNIFGVIESPIYYLWGADYYSSTIPLYDQGSYLVWSKAQSEKENAVIGSRFELCWRYPKRKKEVWFVRSINQSSEPKSNIVDLYGGSGSTLIGAEQTSRNSFLMELDPKYVDVIVKRWQEYTGKDAIHEESGKTYAELSNQK